jgi:hypothetical protein
MQRLQFALFQMDEAKRYLTDGCVPALRVGLMLLDNAAEILLDRWIAADLSTDRVTKRLQSLIREAAIPEDHPGLSDILEQQLLSRHERKRVAQFFDEKIRYLTEIKREVSPSVGAVLSHLHRYRNEAYHSGRVRAETLSTYVVIQLDLCCQLAESLKPSAGYNSGDDYSWLKKRFGVKPIHLFGDETLASVVAVLREAPTVSKSAILETLAGNLEHRLADVDDALDFICRANRVEMDRRMALRDAQEYTLNEMNDEPPYRSVPRRLDEQLSIEQLRELTSVPDRIRSASDSVASFEVYADADSLLERIEFVVSRLMGAIEQASQIELDAARGK